MSAVSVAIVIPVYNHAVSLAEVVRRALAQNLPVIVVDDGSNDGSGHGLEQLFPEAGLHVVHLPRNMGKGAAICAGAEKARQIGASHILTIDADGQHFPDDCRFFLQAMKKDNQAIIVGARDFSVANVPGASRFGRSFSAFWMLVQTGVRVSDMQSGFRLYPLKVLEIVKTTEKGYAFEVEILVRASWAGFAIHEIPIQVHYPPAGQRISHFRLFADNIRISLLNTRLTVRAMTPVPLVRNNQARLPGLCQPIKSLRILLRQANPGNLGKSAGISLAISTLPLPGIQTILLLLAIGRFSLDRCCSILVVPLTWPPVVPGLAVLAGYRLRHGEWLTEFSIRTLGYEAPQRLLDWIVGATCLAPVLGLVGGLLVFCTAWLLRKTANAD